MNPNPRQLTVLAVVQAQGSVTVEQLAEKLGVTLQTVRRDVQRLADEGLLARFHGGARVAGSTIENIAHKQRENLNPEGKLRIARSVAKAVPNGCSLILNIGTTTEAIAFRPSQPMPPCRSSSMCWMESLYDPEFVQRRVGERRGRVDGGKP